VEEIFSSDILEIIYKTTRYNGTEDHNRNARYNIIKYAQKISLIRTSRQFGPFLFAHYDLDDHIAAISDRKLPRVALA
jgi:hypothetical protein